MANPNKQNTISADGNGNGLLSDQQDLVADASNTIATITAGAATATTLTYTANDPGTTPDGAVTIADGTALVAAEVYETFDEFESSISALVTLTTELRTDHGTFKTDIDNLATKINSVLDILEAHGLMSDA